MHVRGSGSIIVGSNSFNQTPAVVTGLGYECKPDSPISFDSYLDTTTDSSIFLSYALSENAENVNNDFVTLEQFLKEDTTLCSFDQLENSLFVC